MGLYKCLNEGRAINQTVQATTWVQTNPIPKLKDLLIFDCATCPGISYISYVVVYASFNSYYYFNRLYFFGLVSYTTELLEIHADDPKLHVLFIPGNPGKFGFILFCI